MKQIQQILEPARQIPVIEEADVVVIGGGPGGLPAAVAAARQGARTVLIERYGVLGGLATTCLMGPFFGYAPVRGRYAAQAGPKASAAESLLLGGIPVELVRRLQTIGGAPSDDDIEWHAIRFDPELFKLVCDEIVNDAHVTTLLHAYAVGAIVENRRIQAVVIESKSGRQAITGKVFVDGTGDGDIAAFSGCSFTKGRPADGLTQSMGTRFRIGNVRPRTKEEIAKGNEIVREAIAAGKIKPRGDNFIDEIGSTVRDGEVTPDTTRCAGDGTDVRHLTRAEFKIRKDTFQLVEFLKAHVPGFEASYLIDLPFTVGVRETRQVEGLYKLSDRDVLGTLHQPDVTVARGCWWVDIHCPLGNIYPGSPRNSLCSELCKVEEFQFHKCIMKSRFKDQLPPAPFLRENEYYDIPYGCLVARDIDNLLVSGRCISATHVAMASSRVIGTCFAIAEAAGVAAAVCSKEQSAPAGLDVARLQALLRANGVPL